MTAKQAVKARCRDCLAGSRACGFTGCALKGLAQAKGKAKARMLKAYCRWCLNGHLFSMCNSPDCAVYQFRKEHGHGSKHLNLELKAGYRGGLLMPEPESVKTCGKGREVC